MLLRPFSARARAMIGQIIRGLGIVETIDSGGPRSGQDLRSGARRVFRAAALRAALREDIMSDVVHADTTSWSAEGLLVRCSHGRNDP